MKHRIQSMQRLMNHVIFFTLILLCSLANPESFAAERGVLPAIEQSDSMNSNHVRYRTIKVDGLDIFYREAGSPSAPTVLLLHGFPSSSHMFRNLIPALANQYHVVAPDYPGFGYSSAPSTKDFDYTFDHLSEVVDHFSEALGLKRYAIYVQDYGAPIGFRIAKQHPDRIAAIVVQNGNAYDEGLQSDFWLPIKAYWKDRNPVNATALLSSFELKATKWQYTHGVHDEQNISPDAWVMDQALLDRAGNKDIQLALFYSYGSNPPLYPQWQDYFRTYQPPNLIVWGKNDLIFPPAGAEPFKRDLKNVELHWLDTGHFALEEDGDKIAAYMRAFLRREFPRNN